MRAVIFLSVMGAIAPLQCPSPRGPELAREESPGEALWLLSERFGEQRNESSRRATLRYLIERYPTSRWAERARLAMSADGGAQ